MPESFEARGSPSIGRDESECEDCLRERRSWDWVGKGKSEFMREGEGSGEVEDDTSEPGCECWYGSVSNELRCRPSIG